MFQGLTGRTPAYLDFDSYKRYAVAAAYLPETGSFLLEVRSGALSRQPGEICFPGGLVENGEQPMEAALRETAEELLVARESISVIAPLDILVTHSKALIYPFLAEIRGYGGTYSTDEVQEVFTVPFKFFLSAEPRIEYTRLSVEPEDPAAMSGLLGTDRYPWHTSANQVLFYRYGDKLIWGMTARFLHNIVQLYRGELR